MCGHVVSSHVKNEGGASIREIAKSGKTVKSVFPGMVTSNRGKGGKNDSASSGISGIGKTSFFGKGGEGRDASRKNHAGNSCGHAEPNRTTNAAIAGHVRAPVLPRTDVFGLVGQNDGVRQPNHHTRGV